MPARRWPRAVRALYLWGPAAFLGGGLAAMSLAPAPSATAAAEDEQPVEESAAQDRAERSASALRRAGAGVARFSLWADDAAESDADAEATIVPEVDQPSSSSVS
ncbi:hypothetical protein GCM10027060_12040 [Nesterenkonia halophila]